MLYLSCNGLCMLIPRKHIKGAFTANTTKGFLNDKINVFHKPQRRLQISLLWLVIISKTGKQCFQSVTLSPDGCLFAATVTLNYC